jgi:hypothetical protein
VNTKEDEVSVILLGHRGKWVDKNPRMIIFIVYDLNLIQYLVIPLRRTNMQYSVATLFLFSSLFLASSVYATGVCLTGYGNTPDEAFKVGTNLLNKMAVDLGKEPFFAKLQIRILPENKKILFTVLFFAMDKPTSCDLPKKPQPAESERPNCTKNICSI